MNSIGGGTKERGEKQCCLHLPGDLQNREFSATSSPPVDPVPLAKAADLRVGCFDLSQLNRSLRSVLSSLRTLDGGIVG